MVGILQVGCYGLEGKTHFCEVGPFCEAEISDW